MIEQIYLWGILLLFLFPIIVFGVLVVKKINAIKQVEQILPAGIILGLTVFTFLINLCFFVLPGEKGIVLAYIWLLVLLVGLKIKLKFELFEIPVGKDLFFWIISLVFWGGLVFWKGAHALIGGDIRGYFAVSASLIKGNYPPLTPWQSAVPLSYHLGSFELLAAFQYLTDLTFDFLHIFFSTIFILCSIQIIIWLFGRSKNFSSFLVANLAALAGFVSFGFFKIPSLNSLREFKLDGLSKSIIWLRNLPKPADSIESYGVPTDLDSLIYIIFHNNGLAILLLLILLMVYPSNENKKFGWLVFLIILATLALVNESIFIPFLPLGVVWVSYIIFKENMWKTKIKKIAMILLIGSALMGFVLFGGGVISANFVSKVPLEKSVEIFPSKEVFRSQALGYHLNSMRTKVLPSGWISIGLETLILVIGVMAIFVKFSKNEKKVYLIFFLTSIFAIVTYNFIVPKYVMANSNRIIVLAFQFLGMLVVFLLIPLFRLVKGYLKFLLIAILILIILPTVLPPLAFMSTTRFGENKLLPKKVVLSAQEAWIKKNVSINDYVTVLDDRSPHPSGVAELMKKTGSLSPLFVGGFRTYTIEPGPEYTDIVYLLNPTSLEKLKIKYILYTSDYFKTLPKIRQMQLNDPNYFEEVFLSSDKNSFSKVVRINEAYLSGGGDLEGSFEELNRLAPYQGKYYIDSERNFDPDFIRRPLIFTLRGRHLYFAHQSGVYQHVETPVPFTEYTGQKDFDYLVLSKRTNPHEICDCQVKLIWFGIKDKVYLWKVLKS